MCAPLCGRVSAALYSLKSIVLVFCFNKCAGVYSLYVCIYVIVTHFRIDLYII